MNKIKSLLEKAGCQTDLVGKICEALEDYKVTLREQYDIEYQNKVEQAKKVCIDETESHKRELARRVQIFCETKTAAIEAQLAKQSALSESEAMTKLKNIISLLEGIEPNGELNGQATAVIEKARLKIQQVNEEKQRAVEAVNRQTAIAEKVLKHNRQLTTENVKLKRLVEAEAITESHQLEQRKRIDIGRSKNQPVTTRKTLVENQSRQPVTNSESNVRIESGNRFGINDIAENMDEDLV